MRLAALPEVFAIVRLPAGSGIPWWAATGVGLVAFVRSADEVSLVCEDRLVPDDETAVRGYRALRVEGPLSFSLTGVLASLAVPLAAAAVPIFVVSTFDTDCVLVPSSRLEDAMTALRAAGHELH